MSDDRPRRNQSATERDLAGIKARQARAASPSPVEFVPEEVTGRYEGEQLEEMRALQPMGTRVGKLEKKFDDLKDNMDRRLNGVEVGVAKMSGQLEVLPKLVDAVKDSVQRAAQRDHVTFTAQVDLDTAKKLDTIKAGESKREWVSTLLKYGPPLIALVTAAFAAGRC